MFLAAASESSLVAARSAVSVTSRLSEIHRLVAERNTAILDALDDGVTAYRIAKEAGISQALISKLRRADQP